MEERALNFVEILKEVEEKDFCRKENVKILSYKNKYFLKFPILDASMILLNLLINKISIK